MNYITILEAGAAQTQSPLVMIGIWVVMIAFMYFVLIRPQRKRQKELQMLQNSIKVGDNVLLNSGIFGKVVDTSNNGIFIIELGLTKNVRVPVQKTAISGKVEKDFLREKPEKEDKKEAKKETKKDNKKESK